MGPAGRHRGDRNFLVGDRVIGQWAVMDTARQLDMTMPPRFLVSARRVGALALALTVATAAEPLRAQRASGTMPALSALQAPETPARSLTLDEVIDLAEARSEQIAIAQFGVARAEAGEQRARSERLPQVAGAASYDRTIKSEFSGIFSGDLRRTTAAWRRRLLGTAVRPAQRVPAEPGVLAGALCRRAHRRPAAAGRRGTERRRQLAEVRSGPAGARRDAGVLRRRADRPAGGHRRGLAAAGGSHRRAGGTGLQGRPQPRVRVAPRPRHARQPAPERHPRAGEPDARVPSAEAVARDPVGSSPSRSTPISTIRRSPRRRGSPASSPQVTAAPAAQTAAGRVPVQQAAVRRPGPRGDAAHRQVPAPALRLASTRRSARWPTREPRGSTTGAPTGPWARRCRFRSSPAAG